MRVRRGNVAECGRKQPNVLNFRVENMILESNRGGEAIFRGNARGSGWWICSYTNQQSAGGELRWGKGDVGKGIQNRSWEA